jgi:hypothetical protein
MNKHGYFSSCVQAYELGCLQITLGGVEPNEGVVKLQFLSWVTMWGSQTFHGFPIRRLDDRGDGRPLRERIFFALSGSARSVRRSVLVSVARGLSAPVAAGTKHHVDV